VSFTDWLLFLHVLSAFALVGALAVFWALVLATRPVAPVLSSIAAGRIVRPTTVLVIAGTVGTLVFGVWLAIDIDGYQLWDGWILAALILWAVSGWLGNRAGHEFTKTMEPGGAPESRRLGLRFHTASSLVVAIILVLMIWKPGA
jgi:hypothetical protein